jgi:hypothetical protein
MVAVLVAIRLPDASRPVVGPAVPATTAALREQERVMILTSGPVVVVAADRPSHHLRAWASSGP